MKSSRVRRLMPDPGTLRPPLLQIAIGNGFAERQDSIVMAQIDGAHRLRIRNATMMSVMEQCMAAQPRRSFSDPLDQRRIVPFVDDHRVRILEHSVQIKRVQRVQGTGELWIETPKCLAGGRALFCDQFSQTPAIRGLVNIHCVSSREQLRCDASQEMRVAVVPVRSQ